MLLQEIPALPFSLDVQSANEWLDNLPLGNIRECCQRFLPVLQALNVYPMQMRLRFDILEHCHPIVQGLARGLAPYFMDAQFPMDEKTRKIASLAARFHLEAALGYRQLVESAAFADGFTAAERALILGRALDHLLHGMLRSAQVYEAPSSSVRSSLKKLYRLAETNGMLEQIQESEGKPPASARELFVRALLFGLAAPRNLPQADMQRLFDLLANPAGREAGGPVSDESGLRSVFCYDPEDVGLLVPVSPAAPPPSDLPRLSAEKFLPALRDAARAAGQPEGSPLSRVSRRLGERLPCQDDARGRRVALCTGFRAIVPMLKDIEFRRSKPGRRSEAWPSLNELELAPLDSLSAPKRARFTGRTLAETVATAETSEKTRMAEVVPTELPGFYLLDSGRWMLRSGLLVGLNSDDEWIQVGVVRCGQIRDGRFWHSFELLGAKPRLVRVRSERIKDGVRDALWLDGGEPDAEASLVAEPCKWRGGDTIAVDGAAGKQLVRVIKLVEATTAFYRFTVMNAEPPAAEA